MSASRKHYWLYCAFNIAFFNTISGNTRPSMPSSIYGHKDKTPPYLNACFGLKTSAWVCLPVLPDTDQEVSSIRNRLHQRKSSHGSDSRLAAEKLSTRRLWQEPSSKQSSAAFLPTRNGGTGLDTRADVEEASSKVRHTGRCRAQERRKRQEKIKVWPWRASPDWLSLTHVVWPRSVEACLRQMARECETTLGPGALVFRPLFGMLSLSVISCCRMTAKFHKKKPKFWRLSEKEGPNWAKTEMEQSLCAFSFLFLSKLQ